MRSKQTAREVLPPDMSFDWADMSFQERRAPGVAVVFALAIFLVFLILAAQYESWGLPFSVLLGTPFAAFGAYLGLWLARQFMGPSYVNNVFAQIGLIMLIGLAAKNAILIVEFAKMEHEQGKPLVEAALSAAKLRFRPILMTAFAFILGVVPLLTASGAGAEARKVMGMTVFSGMLVATILGVLLIPMLYVAVEKVIGGRSSTRRLPAPVPPPDAGRRTRAGEPLRWCDPPHCSRLVLTSAVAVAAGRVRASAPTTRGPQMPTPPQYRFVDGAAQAESLADAPWFAGVRRPGAAGAHPGGDRQQPRPAGGGGARRRGARPRRHREVVPLSAGRRRRQLRRAAGVERIAGGRTDDEDTTHQSGSYGFQLSWELDLFGRLRRAARSGAGPGAGERAGPARRARHAGRRCRVQLLPAARARPAARDRAADAPPQRRDRHLFPEPAGRRRVEPPRARSHPAPTGRRPRPRSRTSSSRSPSSRTRSRCCSAGRRGQSRASALDAGEAAAAADSARPAGVAARAAARRRAGGAVPGGGQRRHRRGQGAVLPDDQPDRISRRRQRRSHDSSSAATGRSGRSARGCCSRCSRAGGSAGISRRCRRASTRRSPSTRRPRSTATAKSPTRW